MTGSVHRARDAAECVVAVCDVLAGLVPTDVDAVDTLIPGLDEQATLLLSCRTIGSTA